MTMKSIGLHVLAIAAGVFLAASPAMGQSCPKQSATRTSSSLRGVNRANAFLHCTAGLPRPTAPSIRGNVQVRP